MKVSHSFPFWDLARGQEYSNICGFSFQEDVISHSATGLLCEIAAFKMDDQLQKPKIDPKVIKRVDQKYILVILCKQYVCVCERSIEAMLVEFLDLILIPNNKARFSDSYVFR